jgi:hypothetical protein
MPVILLLMIVNYVTLLNLQEIRSIKHERFIFNFVSC